jgi:2-polyprenyl-6-methoxyphenol hydroxylase-like FAD-dependent oxidoreductase
MRGLKTRCPFVALMPQWEFLNFLSAKASRYSDFDLRMEHEAIDLVCEGNRIQGVTVRTPNGIERIDADLVVACDGRHSTVRATAGLRVHEIGVPIDVLWFRIGKDSSESAGHVLGNVNYGKVLVLIDRGDYYQAGLIIRKDTFAEIKEAGLDAFRTTISRIVPALEGRADEWRSWDQVKLLSVQINRLRRWSRPGLLCIGDAAHAMSPAFGVGINLAIQDAVASANLLADTLRRGQVVDGLLGQVQARREFPTRVTQMLQVLAHKGFESIFRQKGAMRPPMPMKIAVRIPGMKKAVARVVGIGVRPEHIRPSIRETRRSGDELWLRRIAAFCAGIAAAASVAWRGL